MADYNCFPIWDATGNPGPIDPLTLHISNMLRQDLLAWASVYDVTLNRENWDNPGFTSEVERIAFDQRGRELWQRLSYELKDTARVIYYSEVEGRIIENH